MKTIILSFGFLLGHVLCFAQTKPGVGDFFGYTQNLPGSSTSFKMVPIKGGKFLMGSPKTEPGRDGDEGPQKTVAISPFWMGVYEVTFDEYEVFLQDLNFSQNSDADIVTRPSPPYLDFTLGMGKEGGFPANSMQQYAAIMYCRWLYNKTGIFYRLPTEAEWEYACRAGAKTKYFFGNTDAGLEKYAWFAKNSNGVYHQCGKLKPNKWGLYDMLGNVGEWVLDQYVSAYYDTIKKNTTDPLVKPSKRYPITIKGGTYQDEAKEIRPANRLSSNSKWNARDPQIPRSKWWNTDAPFIGFRVIRPYKQPAKEEAEIFFNQFLIQ